jgi:TIR domain/Sulfatase-modifying factor enzyme 1
MTQSAVERRFPSSEVQAPNGLTSAPGDLPTVAAAPYDFFIAHAAPDIGSAERLFDALGTGVRVFLASRSVLPGDDWDGAISTALEHCSTTLVMVSRNTRDALYEREEIAAAIAQSRSPASHQVVPIFLDDDPYVPYGLLLKQGFRVGPNDSLEMIAQRLLDLTKSGLSNSNSVSVPPPAGVCPYKGLAAYGEGDAELFFGREFLIDSLLSSLAERKFVAVVGRSGSGKTSLLRAGLVPALRDGRLREAVGNRIVWMTPGEHPLGELRRRLETSDAHPLFLVVDQFEEAFTLCPDQSERVAFLAELRFLLSDDSRIARIVIALRADQYGGCADEPGFGAIISQSQILVGPMTEAQLVQAVERPARQVGLGIDPALTNAVVTEAATHPHSLPLISHALAQTWVRREGKILTLRGFREAGGVSGALAATAESFYGGLDVVEQRELRRIFLELVAPADDGRDYRRRVARTELINAARDVDGADLIDRILATRLVTVNELGEVEVIHEALIRSWPRLGTWIDDARSSLLAREHLARDAQEWLANQRDPAYLYRDAQLAAVDALPNRDQITSAFLRASKRHQGKRRILRAVGFGAVLVLLAIPMMLWFQALVKQRSETSAKASSSSPTTRLVAAGATFAIDRHEVSVGQYARCVRFRACAVHWVPQVLTPIEPEPDIANERALVWVSAIDAQAFCRWLGRELPTVQQLEAMFASNAEMIWSPTHVPKLDSRKLYLPDPVRSDRLNYGNVTEWTRTPSAESRGQAPSNDLADDLMTRGPSGSFLAQRPELLQPNRVGETLDNHGRAEALAGSRSLGFRCVSPTKEREK